MKKLRNLQAGGVKTWLIYEALAISRKKPLNIVYEASKGYIFSFSFGRRDVLLV